MIGGYIYGQDPDLPTMKNWQPKSLPMGAELRAELESFRQDFQQPHINNPYWEKANKAQSANTFMEAVE